MATLEGMDTVKRVRKIGDWLERGSSEAGKIVAALYDLQRLEVSSEILQSTKIMKIVERFCNHQDANVARKAKQLCGEWKGILNHQHSSVKAEVDDLHERQDVKPIVEPAIRSSKRTILTSEEASSSSTKRKRNHDTANCDDVKPSRGDGSQDVKPKPVRYADIDLFAKSQTQSSKKQRQEAAVSSEKEKLDRNKRSKTSAAASSSESRSKVVPELPLGLFAKPPTDLKLSPADFVDDFDDMGESEYAPAPATTSGSNSNPDTKPSLSAVSRTQQASASAASSSPSRPSADIKAVKRRAQPVKNEEDQSVFLRKKSSGSHLFVTGAITQGSTTDVTGSHGRVPTLVECCQRVLVRYADSIEYVGACPFSLLSDAVQRLTPNQLARFDSFNPQLAKETKPCWKELVQRTFKVDFEAGRARRRHGESWSDTFWRLTADRDQRLSKLAAAARGRMNQVQSHERTARVTNEIRLPPEVARRAVAQRLDPLIFAPMKSASSNPSSSGNAKETKTHVGPLRVLPSRSFAMSSNGSIARKSVVLSQAPMLRKTLMMAKSCGELNAYRKAKK